MKERKHSTFEPTLVSLTGVGVMFFLAWGIGAAATLLLNWRKPTPDYELYFWVNGALRLGLTAFGIAMLDRRGWLNDEEYSGRHFSESVQAALPGFALAAAWLIENAWRTRAYWQPVRFTYLASALFFAFTSAWLQEAVCRDYLLKDLVNLYGRNRHGARKGMILSCVVTGLFPLVHLAGTDPGHQLDAAVNIITAVILGLYLCLVYQDGGNLWPGIFVQTLMWSSRTIWYSMLNEAYFLVYGDEAAPATLILRHLVIPLLPLALILPSLIRRWKAMPPEGSGRWKRIPRTLHPED